MRSHPSFAYKQKNEAVSARPFAEAQLNGRLPARVIPKSAAAVFGQDHAHEKGKAERRKAHCPTNVRDKRGVRTVFSSAPTFRRSRLRHSPPHSPPASTPMAQLQNRVSRSVGWQVFCPLRQKVPRLSTLRADRSLCRSTGDPKPPGNGRDELPRAGTASRSSSIRRHRLTSLNNERDGRRYLPRDGKVKGV